MSNNQKGTYKGSDKAKTAIQDSLARSIFNTLIANRIPISIADKLSHQAATRVDMVTLYSVVAQDIQSLHQPKQRILDRTIVHMFEILFRLINAPAEDKKPNAEFFNLVPRGECLDLFLQLVKEYCMGDIEIQGYTAKIEPLTQQYNKVGVIDWDSLYQSEAFKGYLSGLLKLILTHLKEDKKPIPALENRIPTHFQPYRINSFLNQVCKLNQSGQIGLGM